MSSHSERYWVDLDQPRVRVWDWTVRKHGWQNAASLSILSPHPPPALMSSLPPPSPQHQCPLYPHPPRAYVSVTQNKYCVIPGPSSQTVPPTLSQYFVNVRCWLVPGKHRTLKLYWFNLCSAGIDFIRQNLTSVVVRFWRIKSIPAL